MTQDMTNVLTRATDSQGIRFDEGGQEDLYDLALRGEVESVTRAIQNGVDVNHIYGEWGTLIEAAFLVRHLPLARQLLLLGADSNIHTADSVPLLHREIMSDPEERATVVVVFLLDNGADINIRGLMGSTPLMTAALYSRVNITGILLDSGADTKLLDDLGRSALDYARLGGGKAIIELLQTKM